MFVPLTPQQLAALRAAPLGGSANKLRVAIAIGGVKQADIADTLQIPRPNLSNLVTGKYGDLQVETARRLAEFFGCAIEDLFPPRDADGDRRSGHERRSGEERRGVDEVEA